MTWDGKKTAPMRVRRFGCGGCGKSDGTLQQISDGIKILAHKHCRRVALRRLAQIAKQELVLA